MTSSQERPAAEAGQVWKDRRRNPTSVFLILRVWVKAYPAKGQQPACQRTRVTGVLSCDGSLQPDRDLDLDSMYRMFPHLCFDPTRVDTIEDK